MGPDVSRRKPSGGCADPAVLGNVWNQGGWKPSTGQFGVSAHCFDTPNWPVEGFHPPWFHTFPRTAGSAQPPEGFRRETSGPIRLHLFLRGCGFGKSALGNARPAFPFAQEFRNPLTSARESASEDGP